MVDAHGNAAVLNGTAATAHTAVASATGATTGATTVAATAATVLTVAATKEVHRFAGRGVGAIVLIVAHAVVVCVSRSAAAAIA